MSNKNKKAFTIIELVVIIAVIAILALLAIPQFMNYTHEAEFTRLLHDARLIEDACEKYYLAHGDWPRASDTPYTAEQVNAFAQKVYDQTGNVIVLEPEGKYYDIDMQKLGRYVTVNSDPRNFVLQNPVGKVYILEPETNARLKSKTNSVVIELVTDKQTAIVGENITVTTLIKNGNDQPVSNVKVSFTTTLGTITPQTTITDEKGIATAVISSDVSGTATIMAKVNDVTAEYNVSFTLPYNMQGNFVPDGTIVTASGYSYGLIPSNAIDKKIAGASRWLASGYKGWLQLNFPTPQTISAIQISAGAYPATNERYTIYGYQNGTWKQISSSVTFFVPVIKPDDSNIAESVLSPIPVTKGTYEAIFIDVDGGASWVAIVEVTLIP